MQFRLQLSRDETGIWRVGGLPQQPVRQFGELGAAVEYAKSACNAEPAMIELTVDGFYAAVHQTRGWPHRLSASGTGASGGEGGGRRQASASKLACLRDRLRRGIAAFLAPPTRPVQGRQSPTSSVVRAGDAQG